MHCYSNLRMLPNKIYLAYDSSSLKIILKIQRKFYIDTKNSYIANIDHLICDVFGFSDLTQMP